MACHKIELYQKTQQNYTAADVHATDDIYMAIPYVSFLQAKQKLLVKSELEKGFWPVAIYDQDATGIVESRCKKHKKAGICLPLHRSNSKLPSSKKK